MGKVFDSQCLILKSQLSAPGAGWLVMTSPHAGSQNRLLRQQVFHQKCTDRYTQMDTYIDRIRDVTRKGQCINSYGHVLLFVGERNCILGRWPSGGSSPIRRNGAAFAH